MPVAASDYPFLEIVGTIIIFFAWVAWFWVLVSVLSDIFRRHDIGGGSKAIWTLGVIIIPFLGVLIYITTQGRHMAERNAELIKAQQAQLDDRVREAAGSPGVASQIAQAKELRDSGALTEAEFEQVKAKALAS